MPRDQVPKWLRSWATALLQVADAVLPLVEHAPLDPAGGVRPSQPVLRVLIFLHRRSNPQLIKLIKLARQAGLTA